MTLILGPIRHAPRCAGPGCGRREGPLVLVTTRHGLVALCPSCKAARDRVIQRYFARRTAQAASARFWAERGLTKGVPA